MSVLIKQDKHNNFSQSLSTCETSSKTVFIFPEQGIRAQLEAWVRRYRQRKQLATLDDHLLADIGLTRDQVKLEIEKPFWK